MNQPEKKELKLDDAFIEPRNTFNGDIKVKVTINYGKNKALMEACEPLKDLEAAVDAAISEMPDEFVIKKFLLSNKAEVKGILLTEYDGAKVLAQKRREAEFLTNKQVATDMLRDDKPLEKIAKYSCLAEGAIRKLAVTLGLMVI